MSINRYGRHWIVCLCLAAVLTGHTYGADWLADFNNERQRGLLVDFHFREGAGDAARNAAADNPGTIVGATWQRGAPSAAGGMFHRDDPSYETDGHALDFDGRAAFVRTAQPLDLAQAEALTVGAWIKPRSLMPTGMTEQGYIVSGSHGNHAGFTLTTYYNAGLAAMVVTDKGAFVANAFEVLEKDKWQHVAFSWNGRLLRLYVDGKPVGKPTATHGRLLPYNAPLHIGKAADRDGQYYDGLIGPVRLFNTAFDAESFDATGQVVITPAVNDDPSGRVIDPPRPIRGRDEPIAPLVAFEDLRGWTVRTYRGIVEAQLIRTQEERLWGDYVAKLTLKAGSISDDDRKTIELIPPEPIAIDHRFDAISLWVSGLYWAKPGGVRIDVRVEDRDGEIHAIDLRSREWPFVLWSGWSLAHFNLDHSIEPGAKFLGLMIHGFDGSKEEVVYLDSLAFYQRDMTEPLDGHIPTWADIGAPTTPDTILPPLERQQTFTNTVERDGQNTFVLSYNGDDETITYRYTPRTGTLSDIELIDGDNVIEPMRGGGFVFDGNAEAKLIDCDLADNHIRTRWQWKVAGRNVLVTLAVTIRQKSLVIDMQADQPLVSECVFCAVAGARDAKPIEVPYLVLRGSVHKSKDPRVLWTNGRFISAFVDWYNSDASELFGDHGIDAAGAATINGGSAYFAKTNGERNPPRERLFLTCSSRFSETLPNIPNPTHAWLETTRDLVWATRSWYVNTLPQLDYYDREYAFYKKLHDFGIRDLAIRHHVSLYRQYVPRRGENMTYTDTTEPQLGGDDALAEMIRKAQDELGFRIGLYTNHTLVSPMSLDIFSDDTVSLDPAGQWRYGSGNDKMMKVTNLLHWQQVYNRRLEAKFDPACSYPDQYTCRPPWALTDYDHRAPGAGMFSTVFRVFAKALLNEAEHFDGPALSEGIVQWMLAGYCDSYAQPGKIEQDTLVDFQLRRLHMLSNDCGFHLLIVDSHDDDDVDQLLAAELAYGHTGHLFGCTGGAPPREINLALLKSYYMIRQIQSLYALTPIETIRYNSSGGLLDTEAAIASDAVANNQVQLEYANGLQVVVNRNAERNWDVTLHGRSYTLPPNGHVAALGDELLQYTALVDGRRVDYAHGSMYTFCNGGGAATDFGNMRAAGAYIVIPRDGAVTVTPALPTTRETLQLCVDRFAGRDVVVRSLSRDGQVLATSSITADGDGWVALMIGDAFKYELAVAP